ncbi:hypothetical protein O181_100497 [Austropuccinia psidii MF-1]|uniref:DUF4939 domain-containing protein n=1 Tax=Austropuccinia psidii MF-1 TaxID=1389203 RepID=A0A9Q3PHK6_9BASI|nr:hypothetical protein [Austropuccinia psidii MF-1]
MTQIMANHQAALSSEASRPPALNNPSIISPYYFYGSQSFKVGSFIDSFQLVFCNYQENISEHKKNVLYATAFLTGTAVKWIEPYVFNFTNQDPTQLLNNGALFKSQLFTLFGDPNEVRKAEVKLGGLRMKVGGHFSLCIADLRILVSRIGDWGEWAFMHNDRKGLGSRILDQLAYHPSIIVSLHELMDFTLEFDTIYHEKKNENKTEASNSSFSNPQNSSSSRHKKKKDFNFQKREKPLFSLLNEYFELIGFEKERRLKEGLCVYCGWNNSIEACVKILKTSLPNQEANFQAREKPE